MKISCGPTWDEILLKEMNSGKNNWHSWFAWYPVKVGSYNCRWLETVERRGTYYPLVGWDSWKYKTLK